MLAGYKPFTRQQNFRQVQIETGCMLSDDNLKFDENRRKFSKRVENTVGKGEIAHYEQFLLFPQCFQKACFPGASRGVIVWEWVNPFPNKPFVFMCLLFRFFKNNIRKGEIAHKEWFLLFPQCFLPFLRNSVILIQFKIVVCKLFEFWIVWNLSFGKS